MPAPSWNSNRANIMSRLTLSRISYLVCLTENLHPSLLFLQFCPAFFLPFFSIMNSNNTHQDTPPLILKKRGKQCAVYGCHNSYYNDKGFFASYHFFSFPTDPKTRNRWCNLIKRQHWKDDFNVTAATVVCSEHFRQEDIISKLTRRYLKKGMWHAKTDIKKSYIVNISLHSSGSSWNL